MMLYIPGVFVDTLSSSFNEQWASLVSLMDILSEIYYITLLYLSPILDIISSEIFCWISCLSPRIAVNATMVVLVVVTPTRHNDILHTKCKSYLI